MTNPDFVIPFETATYPTLTCIDDPALVDTPYSSKSWRCFTDASGRAVSGIWEAGPHFERCICDFDEMCHILEGEVRLTDASGRSKIFGRMTASLLQLDLTVHGKISAMCERCSSS